MNKGDQDKFWQTIGDVLGKKNDQKIGKVYRYGTEELCIEQESVEVINDFFATIGEDVMKDQPIIEYKQLDTGFEIGKRDFKTMSVDIFLEIIAELSYSKSSGIDGLNSKFIIDAMKAIPEVFVRICNK